MRKYNASIFEYPTWSYEYEQSSKNADEVVAKKKKWRKEGRCPECGELGRFINCVPVCSTHGPYELGDCAKNSCENCSSFADFKA